MNNFSDIYIFYSYTNKKYIICDSNYRTYSSVVIEHNET